MASFSWVWDGIRQHVYQNECSQYQWFPLQKCSFIDTCRILCIVFMQLYIQLMIHPSASCDGWWTAMTNARYTVFLDPELDPRVAPFEKELILDQTHVRAAAIVWAEPCFCRRLCCLHDLYAIFIWQSIICCQQVVSLPAKCTNYFCERSEFRSSVQSQ